MPEKPYCEPWNAGLTSEPAAVGRAIGKLLDALEGINSHTVQGQIERDCWEMKLKLLNTLRAEGWRIKVGRGDKWQVLPPKGGR